MLGAVILVHCCFLFPLCWCHAQLFSIAFKQLSIFARFDCCVNLEFVLWAVVQFVSFPLVFVGLNPFVFVYVIIALLHLWCAIASSMFVSCFFLCEVRSKFIS